MAGAVEYLLPPGDRKYFDSPVCLATGPSSMVRLVGPRNQERYIPSSMKPSICQVWLRKSDPLNPNLPGAWRDLDISSIGNAAARETAITDTSHMATIWTDLFQSIIAPGPELRWRGNGPGIGRDARIAYSSLLGRYMARAYLTEHEKIRVLVPLDVAERWLQGTPYVIKKDPLGRGLQADWIGIDDCGLVIAEAKGTFDKGVRTWHGPFSRPRILQTAIHQAERTAVFQRYACRKLPAKRWAVASRWGTEVNHCEPTLLAWNSEEDKLDKHDYQLLAKLLLRADLSGVLKGLGHSEAARRLGVGEPSEHDNLGLSQSYDPLEPSDRAPGDLRISVGDQRIEPGFAATVGPFGVQPLRDENDLQQVRRALNLNLNIVVASLSSRYCMAASHDRHWPEAAEIADSHIAERVLTFPKSAISRAGLTVVWPSTGEEIVIGEE